MKPVMLVGIILLVVGILALAYQGFTYTTREKVIDLGPVQVTAEKQKTIPLQPVLGALPQWRHSSNWGYYPSGGLGVVVLILLILLVAGRI